MYGIFRRPRQKLEEAESVDVYEFDPEKDPQSELPRRERVHIARFIDPMCNFDLVMQKADEFVRAMHGTGSEDSGK